MLPLVLSLFLAAAIAEPGAVEVTRLDGSAVQGTIVEWNLRGVTVRTDATTVAVSANDLLTLRSRVESEPSHELTAFVELFDGTRLPFIKLSVRSGEALITLPQSRKPTLIPTDKITRIDFRPASDALSEAWDRVAATEAAGDVVILAKGDGATFDHLVGAIKSVSDEQVVFEWNGDPLPIKRSKVAGVAFYHGHPARLPNAQFLITTNDGRTIAVQSISLSGETLKITTPTSINVDVRLANLTNADFSAGKLTYLSDLKPESSTWTPRIALPKAAALIGNYGASRMNVAFSGSPLTLAWPNEAVGAGREVRSYSKGLALRSRTELVYRLPTGMNRLTATAGIDPAATEQGHVVLQIRADDRVIWEGEIDGKLPPTDIDVELKVARRLQILVDYGRNLDYGDRLHLVEARVTK